MLKIVDNNLNGFLRKNLEEGEGLQIEIHGFSDATPFDVNNPKYYDGLEGTFPKPATVLQEEVNIFYLNDTPTQINLKKGDQLNSKYYGLDNCHCIF